LAWTEITRGHYRRDGQRYASDLTDAEWRLVEPLLPARCRWGRPRVADLRAVLDGLLYILRRVANGAHCRATFRHDRRCRVISTDGVMMASGNGLSINW
jgi:hypothetical protein